MKKDLSRWILRLGLLGFGIFWLEYWDPQAPWAQLLFPRPSSVGKHLVTALSPGAGSALVDVGLTLLRVGTGVLAGSVAGVILGLAVGVVGHAFGWLRTGVDFLRSIPQIALFPLFALLFGIDNFGKIMMAVTSTFLIVFVAAADGTMFGVQERHETFQWIGASSWSRFRHLTFPQSLPSIAVGIRIAASVAMIVVLVAEMLYGTLDGIGYRIYLAQLSYQVDELWGYIIIIGFAGVGINSLLSYLQRRFIPWDRVSVNYN